MTMIKSGDIITPRYSWGVALWSTLSSSNRVESLEMLKSGVLLTVIESVTYDQACVRVITHDGHIGWVATGLIKTYEGTGTQ